MIKNGPGDLDVLFVAPALRCLSRSAKHTGLKLLATVRFWPLDVRGGAHRLVLAGGALCGRNGAAHAPDADANGVG
ncbi:MAG: hypothetical protein R2706_05770 [Acidimicrobiales bacterium]